ncbi:rod shape-determining protein MreC [Faecalibacterium gallinarum]|uniref:Cell shape-determining protein MreC n=1 Tax=Faecalibacterium gallinarum TaxID=2903556 RepID=A0AA37IYW9_9FIRM|nr:rod shape-determining protein MreC [Faecalibacterium gallinarum]GJN64549.1 rod shape-determining protein MreC [Faecalibacterium gallinarum]
MKDFFDTWKFKILIAVAVFLVGLMAYAGANGRLTAAPQELLSVAVAPFQKVAAAVSGGVSSLWEKYTNIDAIMEENETLREENAELRSQMVEYDRLKAENEAYKKLEQIQEENPQNTYVSAFVIGRDTLDEFGGFTLDKGTAHGVERGDTVVSDEGYLLGVVIEADLTSCKVLTILHPSFNASVVVSRTRDNGILTGDASYAEQGLCLFTNLARDSMATVRDQVITTGLGGVYPPDVLVGTIVELLPESSGKSTIAVVEPGGDVFGAKHAFVITQY